MNEIKCPKCGEVFTIDEASYASIVKQVRDDEFHRELEDRKNELEKEKENALKLKEIEKTKEYGDILSEKDKEILNLNSKIENLETEKKLAITEAVSEKEKTIFELTTKLESKEREKDIEKRALEEKYNELLKEKDEAIDYYKDLKAKMSTKMVGETLEQHCDIEFNKIRATAFPRAYFEKDNDITDKTKGDFIFRDYDEDGLEYISIMFEMKNEMDTTATKKTNQSFFEKLDSDRKKKNCEYAVLVSLLEADNELYNQGIVDVSYAYEKMYVIRPQFFIPLITLLRDAAKKTLEYKHEVEEMKAQNIDVTKFEDKLLEFQSGFNKHCELAFDDFNKAIKKIEDTIHSLEKMKEELQKTGNQLRLANNKAMDLSIRKLTWGNPTMTEMFKETSSEE